MANDLIPTNINVPDHIAKRMGKSTDLTISLSGGIGGDFESVPRISLKGSRFRIVEDGEEVVLDESRIDVTIVASNSGLSKNFYDKPWDPNAEPEGPACFSWNGVRPHPDSPHPQSDLCSTCHQNSWGSKTSPSGGDLKACPDSKRLAVVASDDPEGSVYLLTITASVLKSFKTYVKTVAMRNFPINAVRTQLSFDPDASFPKLQFRFNGFIDDESVNIVEARADEDIVGVIVAKNQPEAPAVSSKKTNKPSVVVDNTKGEVEDAEVVEEAPVKKGFGAKKVAAKPEVVDDNEEAPVKKGFGAKKAEPKAEAKSVKKGASAEESIDSVMSDIEALVAGAADDA